MTVLLPAPPDWPDANRWYAEARARAWEAVRRPEAATWLEEYYRVDGDYAGRTFVSLAPVVPDEFTAADLFAVTLLSMRPVGPRVTRALLEVGATRDDLLSRLRARPLAGRPELADADDRVMTAMADLYDALSFALGRDPWVTTGKLCARKRPALFPVRDTLVRAHLGLDEAKSYRVDWQIYRGFMRDPELVATLTDRVQEAGRTFGVQLDDFPLRWLDVVLWRRAKLGR